MTTAGVETAILYLDLAGIVYPFRVAGSTPGIWRYDRQTGISQIPTLLQLSCRSIVRDYHQTERALQWIPKTLILPLLEAAFLEKHDIAADLIIARWPFPSLRLADVFSDGVFPDLSCASFRSIQLERLCESLSYTTGLVSGFIHYLKRSSEGPGRLKCLDITGFPTAEVVAIYLFSHCVIAINEHRQNLLWQRMLQLKAERAKLNPSNPNILADECQVQRCSFREGQGYVARVDLRIDSESMLDQLLPCFNDTDDGGGAAKFRVSIGNLFITGLHESAVMRIFRTVQLHELSGLCLAYSRMGLWQPTVTVDFLKQLEECANLTSLDLSNNGYDFAHGNNNVVMSHIRTLLCKLTKLRRLNLSINRVSGYLSAIVPQSLSLTHLCLDGCRLLSSDINFLTSPNFNRQRLIHLDLAHLRVNSDQSLFPSLKDMFDQVVWPRLSVLLLCSSRFDSNSLLLFSKSLLQHEERISKNHSLQIGTSAQTICDFEDDNLDENQISEFGPGLVYIDISEESSKLNSTALLQSFQYLFQLKVLRYLKIEYPRDCFRSDYMDGYLDLGKKAFFDDYTLRIKQQFSSTVELLYNPNYLY